MAQNLLCHFNSPMFTRDTYPRFGTVGGSPRPSPLSETPPQRAIALTQNVWSYFVVALLVAAVGCTPAGEHSEAKSSGLWGERGGENLSQGGRYHWIRFTFGGDTYVMGGLGEYPSVASRTIRDIRTPETIAVGTEVHTAPTMSFENQDERRAFLVSIAQAFEGFEVRVTSDALGDDDFLRETMPDTYTEKLTWDRATHGNATVEVVFTGSFCTYDDACQNFKEQEWDTHENGDPIRGVSTFMLEWSRKNGQLKLSSKS